MKLRFNELIMCKSKGYSSASLISLLVVALLFIAILIPRVGFLRYNLYTYVDSNTANGIAGAVYAMQDKKIDTIITIEDVARSNLVFFNAKPFTPGSESFKICWKGKDFYIIAVDKKGNQIGGILFPN